MNHWVIAPVIVPMLVALLLLLLVDRLWLQRVITLSGALLGAALVAWLVNRSRFEGMEIYLPGNALPPAGAVLVLDKLATLLLAVTTLLHLAMVAQVMMAGGDRQRPVVPVLQQLLLAGLNGAVLAGDLVSLWLFWSLALVALAGLVPGLWRLAGVGIATLALGLGVATWQGGSADLADLAERGAGGTGLALAVLALWGAGLWATLQAPFGAMVGLAAGAIAGRVLMLLEQGQWLVPAAMVLAAVLTLGAQRSSAVGKGPMVAGAGLALAPALALALALALGLLGSGAAPATPVALWLMVAVALLAFGELGASIGARVPKAWRRTVTLALGLCLATLVVIATLLPGRIPARFASQIDAIARQLHDPQIYITAVMGLPDRPMLAPEPDL